MTVSLGSLAVHVKTNLTAYLAGLRGAKDQGDKWAGEAGKSIGKRLGDFIGDSMKYAVGQWTAQLGSQLAGALTSIPGQAFEATKSYERLTLSLETLVARENALASGHEKVRVTGTAVTHLTDAQIEKYEELQAQTAELSASLAVATERHQKLAAGGKASAAEIELSAIRLQKQRDKLAGVNNEMATLAAQEGKTVTLTQKYVEGQLSMNEALDQAGPKVKDLLGWLTQLTIKSPFEEEQVQAALKTAMSYGFVTDAANELELARRKGIKVAEDEAVTAQRLTEGLLNAAAGAGADATAMDRAALALGQIRAKGKLTGEELRQLMETGLVSVDRIALEMGMSAATLTDKITKGSVDAQSAILAIVNTFEKDFGSAAGRSAASWAGLTSTLSDVKKIGLRELFAGVFNVAKPLVTEVVEKLSDPKFMDTLRGWGEVLGTKLVGAIQSVQVGWQNLQTAGATARPIFDGIIARVQGIATWVQTYVPPMTASAFLLLNTLSTQLQRLGATVIPWVVSTLDRFGAWTTANGPLIQEFVTTVLGALGTTWTWVGARLQEAWAVIQPVLDGLLSIIGRVAETVMKLVTGDWQGAWNSFKEIPKLALDGLGLALGNLAAIVTGWFNTDWETVMGVWQSNWEQLGKIVEILGPIVMEKLAALALTLVPGLNALGGDILGGLAKGIGDNAWKVVQALSEAANKAIDAFAEKLNLHSPSKVFVDFGKQSMEGYAEGVDESRKRPREGLTQAIKGLMQVASSFAGDSHTTQSATWAPVYNVSGMSATEWAFAQTRREQLASMRRRL